MSQGRIVQQIRQSTAQAVPETEPNDDAVREQLERLLASPLFKNSKRYPNLLRYVVEHTLDGNIAKLKERTLGIEVFARDPHYDTNQDPVVRTTAAEIRKRIAQYYHEPGHEAEIRIDLTSGSYVPEFRAPLDKAWAAPIIPSRRRSKAYLWAPLGLAVLIGGLAWLHPWTTRSALDRFWAPVLDSTGSVLLCVGQPRRHDISPVAQQQTAFEPAQINPDTNLSIKDLYTMSNQYVALSDATTLSRLSGLLQAKGKSYHIMGQDFTTFTDLRAEPVVLIGAFNNEWTLRLTGQLRFTFEQDPKTEILWIKDQQNPSQMDWSVDTLLPYMKLTDDYAIISRVLDPTTERIVVVAAGIGKYGTMAAGEFLTDSTYLEAIAKQAPANWEHKNIQVVIATQVIGGNSGPPRVVATSFW